MLVPICNNHPTEGLKVLPEEVVLVLSLPDAVFLLSQSNHL